jgi:hypothetical protein
VGDGKSPRKAGRYCGLAPLLKPRSAPPHHPAVHGRDSIREYLKAPLGHGVSDLAFDGILGLGKKELMARCVA